MSTLMLFVNSGEVCGFRGLYKVRGGAYVLC